MTFFLRKATLDDTPTLERLIAESARGLSRHDYTDAQIEAALGTAWGVDTELIRDGTYFVAESEGEIVACGGWSRRRTLFGGDGQARRQSEVLEPQRDSARIRAFFVRPADEKTEGPASARMGAKRKPGRTDYFHERGQQFSKRTTDLVRRVHEW
jgi:hypothetical protein